MKLIAGIFALVLGVTGAASAQMSGDNPMVGGAAMYKTKDIVEPPAHGGHHAAAGIRWAGAKRPRLRRWGPGGHT